MPSDSTDSTAACMHCGTELDLMPVVTFEGYVCGGCKTDVTLRLPDAVLTVTLAA